MFDDIPPLLDLPAEQQQRYLFNAVCDLIARIARVRPLLLVVEDLHSADAPTLKLIEHLARRVDEMPVLMLATYRDFELDASSPLAHTLGALLRQRHSRSLTLKRLDAIGVEAMLCALSAQEDAQARREYQVRLAELHQELEEAERMGDQVRTDSARRELDAIAGQLSAAYGLGRRRREPNDPAERARIAVAMRIRGALERIEKEHHQLGRHLSRAIQTGTFCTYSPEVPTTWEL
jgi:hypothetical protein